MYSHYYSSAEELIQKEYPENISDKDSPKTVTDTLLTLTSLLISWVMEHS